MSGKCLLDTNIVIALFADEVGVKENLAKTDEVFVASIVLQRKVGQLFVREQLHCEQDAVQLHPKQE